MRGDQYFGANQKFLLWGKFTWKNFPINSPEILLVPSSQNTSQNRALKVDTNWTITPNLINEGGFGFTRFTSGATNSFDGKPGQPRRAGRVCRTSSTTAFRRWTSTTSRASMPIASRASARSLTYDYTDTLIWTKGSHTMKFGLNIQHARGHHAAGLQRLRQLRHLLLQHQRQHRACLPGWTSPTSCSAFPTPDFYDVVRQDNDGLSAHYHFFGQDEWRDQSAS